MKKLSVLLLTGIMTLGLTASGSLAAAEESAEQEAAETAGQTDDVQEEKPESITITTLNGNKEAVEIEVPYDPERIAIIDLAALDIIDNLGLGDRVVGSVSTTIDYLEKYNDNSEIVNLGNVKEADMEAVMECEPDIIFIGGRLSSSYDQFAEIAPVVFLSTETEIGLVESVKMNAKTVASIWGLEEEVDEKLAGFDERIEALSADYSGKTALVGMVTNGSFNLLGNNGRCSIIGNEIGFNNLTGDTEETGNGGGEGRGDGNGEGRGNGEGGEGQGNSQEAGSPHGNESNFEILVDQNPEYIFVLDRDSAIGTEGAQLAAEVMDNELVHGIDAYQNDKIIYLEHPGVWYTAEGGITALDVMLQDLETALNN